jgi:hypothetical protein
MKKLALLTSLGLVVVVAFGALLPGVSAAKKKKTYCQKNGSAVKAKLLGKSKGFYVYREKGGGTVLLCQDKPKFYGSMSWEQGAKLGKLLVVKKKCAVYPQLGKGNPQIYQINFKDFTSGNGQAGVLEVGYGSTGQLLGLSLSTNCALAFGAKVAGVPQIAVKGTSAFGYTGTLYPPVGAGITDKELANVKIGATGTGAATVSWTAAGVPHTYAYSIPAGY